MSTRFLLVRHGACAQMDELLFGRAVDAPLSEHGRLQAEALADALAQKSARRLAQRAHVLVEASPRLRAQQTAHAIASRARLNVRTSADLDEIDFGRWAGLSFAQLAEDPSWKRWNERRDEACTPAGETAQTVRGRVLRILQRLHEEQPAGAVVIITHAEIIRTALLHFLGEPPQRYGAISIAPASISVVRMHAGRGVVLAVNRRVHEHGIDA